MKEEGREAGKEGGGSREGGVMAQGCEDRQAGTQGCRE